jgi:hypothetical protein
MPIALKRGVQCKATTISYLAFIIITLSKN